MEHNLYKKDDYVIYSNSVGKVDEVSFLGGKWRYIIDGIGLFKEGQINRLANEYEKEQYFEYIDLQDKLDNWEFDIK